MRRIFLMSLMAAIVLLPARAPTARAQQVAAQASPIQQIISRYLLPDSATPTGLQSQGTSPLDNVLVAALAEGPADVRKIIDRGRINGLEQDFSKSNSSVQLQLQVSLFRDFAGASADVADPVLLAGLALTTVSSPRFGDLTAAYTTKSGSQETTNIIFVAGRLEVLVTGIGPSGSVSQADIVPLTRLAASRTLLPPPQVSQDELTLLRTQTAPASILHDAYRLLLELYLTPLTPADILANTYAGAVSALFKAGVTNIPAAPRISASDSQEAWAQFQPAYQKLETFAPSSLSARELAYAAATGMYGNLNCHTDFFTPTFYAREIASLRGEAVARVGIMLTSFPEASDVLLRVVSTSPADQAGLKPGDQVVAVDHKTREEVGDHFNELFIGEVGTQVTLSIKRPGSASSFDVTMMRQLIQPTIEQHRVLAGGVGYIEFNDFTEGTTAVDAIRSALANFESAGNVNSWILDLRYNGGGSELTLEQIAGLFVGPGNLIITETQQDGTVQTGRSVGGPAPNQKPLVLLIDTGTASAAEVLTQSLKDLRGATLVGDKTAGCVNGGLPLGLLDGSGVFVSTIDVRSGPSKVALENVGVAPDQTVTLSLSDVVTGKDPQLAAATAAATGSPQPAPATSTRGLERLAPWIQDGIAAARTLPGVLARHQWRGLPAPQARLAR